MSAAAYEQLPGMTAERTSDEVTVEWAGLHQSHFLFGRKLDVLSSETDAANTPTTTLRGGMVLSENVDGVGYVYDADDHNGEADPIGVLRQPLDMLVEGVASTRYPVLFGPAALQYDRLPNIDYAAASRMMRLGFVFDKQMQVDPVRGCAYGEEWLSPLEKGANYTVLAADNGRQFTQITGAVTFTLPTIAHGLRFKFVNSVDANMTIAGSSNICHKNNLSASNVVFSTSSQKIGSIAVVVAQYIGTTLKWVVENRGGTTATVS